MNMLIADDNKQISSILRDYAKKENFSVTVAEDGEAAITLFHNNHFDIILLDVMMPKKDGFQVCREIRAISNVPIIMVTARGEDFEKIMGLDTGSDDYIVKPFSPGEVMARVRAVLRRMDNSTIAGLNEPILVFDNLKINSDNFTAFIDNKPLSLTKKEFEILLMMTSNRSKVFTRENMLNSLWGYDYYGDIRTVDSHMKRLRAKLDAFLHPNWEIKTIWGVGYKFEVLNNEK